MFLVSLPTRFFFVLSCLYLSIPIASLQVFLAMQAPWWQLPYPQMMQGGVLCAAFCLPLSIGLLKIKKSVFFLTALCSSLWVLFSIFFAIFLKNSALGFFNVFLLVFLSFLLFQLKTEMGRSFFDHQLQWYQGLPKAIPFLNCQILSESYFQSFQVSRIDGEGVFIFSPFPTQRGIDSKLKSPTSSMTKFPYLKNLKIPFKKTTRPLALILHFNDLQLRCKGRPTLQIDRGLGIRFVDISADIRKEIEDFIESLKGAGYVF